MSLINRRVLVPQTNWSPTLVSSSAPVFNNILAYTIASNIVKHYPVAPISYVKLKYTFGISSGGAVTTSLYLSSLPTSAKERTPFYLEFFGPGYARLAGATPWYTAPYTTNAVAIGVSTTQVFGAQTMNNSAAGYTHLFKGLYNRA